MNQLVSFGTLRKCQKTKGFLMFSKSGGLEWVKPWSPNFTKWSDTFTKWSLTSLSEFDHFVGLALKGLRVVTCEIFLKDCNWRCWPYSELDVCRFVGFILIIIYKARNKVYILAGHTMYCITVPLRKLRTENIFVFIV